MANPFETAFDGLCILRDLPNTYVTQMLKNFLLMCAQNSQRSHSQLFQDLFALYFLNGKQKGFFVEFGATNGVTLSNSYVLETHFGWSGILVEPARNWHKDLGKNRKAKIDHRCVWNKTGETLEFLETPYGELSTIAEFKDKDANRVGRQEGAKYGVETITLNDLFKIHNAPRDIDYMSVDTEGSELTILDAFDFSRHTIKLMTVEHNYTSDRDKIRKLLDANGFQNVFEPVSKYDDWFVHRSLLRELGGK